MVLREALGEFVTGEVVARHDARHGTDLLEDREVAVDARLSQGPVGCQDLSDGQRTTTDLEHSDEASTSTGEALVGLTKEGRDFVLDLGADLR